MDLGATFLGKSQMDTQFLGTPPEPGSLEKQILRKERYNQHYARTAFDNSASPSIPLMSGEKDFFDYLESVGLLVQAMRRVRQTHDDEAFEEALEARFEMLALKINHVLASNFDHHRFQPDIWIVLASLLSQSQEIRQLAFEDRDLEMCRRHVRFCIASCRRKLMGKVASANRKKFAQRQKENISSCRKYVNELLGKHQQLFVFRVELYAPILKKWWELKDVRAAEAGIDRLLNRLAQGQIVDNLLGYVIARESGPCRGLHYSLLAAQNGYLPRSGRAGAAAVGREWVKHFDGCDNAFLSKANYFNCYELQQPSLFNEIGNVDAADPLSRTALEVAIKGMWDKPIVFDAKMIKCDSMKNPAGTLDGIAIRNLRKGKM